MVDFGGLRRAAVALGALAIIAAAPLAVNGKVGALARIEPGLWQLRDLDNMRAAQQSICVADPLVLMQLRHGNSPCSRLVVENDQKGAVVHYTCPSNGYGQTSLRVETPRLAQIDTQGIKDNQPFAYRAEARRIGTCGRTASRPSR